MRFGAIAAVATGGVLGAIGRWVLTEVSPETWLAPGLLLANLAGSLLLGFTASALRSASERSAGKIRLIGVATGFCGALTSFSGLALRVAELASSGDVGRALANLTLNTVGGLVLVALGVKAHRSRAGISGTGAKAPS